MTQYRTKDGDTVDFIAWKFYGRQDNRIVEQVLDANLGLADVGPSLPAGLLVTLPAIDLKPTAKGVKLWD